MDYFFYFFVVVIGLIFGSFLNALVYRFHEKKSLWERSECPNCHKQIKWYDNVPILSFFILKGRCRNCKQKISWQYPIVELWMGIASVCILYTWMPIYFDNKFPLLFFLLDIVRQGIIIWVLTFTFVYDLVYMEVSDLVVWSGVVSVFLLNVLLSQTGITNMFVGVGIGGGFFLLQYLISKGKWIGGGDIRLGVLMGIILGWQNTILALFISYLLGAIVGVYLLLTKKKEKNSEIPFGTFLTVGTLVAMWWGERIVGWYLGFLS